MPDYKSHSIHCEVVLPSINKRTNIELNDIKRFAFGPDSLLFTAYKLFDYQHSHDTRVFFETLIELIKERKLQDNSKVMAFLYGQLSHFVLDMVMHPLVYYMTEKMPSKNFIKPHTLVEFWMADYIMLKHDKKDIDYYSFDSLEDPQLTSIINETYKRIYNRSDMASRYYFGINSMISFDSLRRSKSNFLKSFCNGIKIGDFFYTKNPLRVYKFLNLKHSKLKHPTQGTEFDDSFDDLWQKSIMLASELIEDVNNYLYLDIPLNNYLIRNDISYNTGFPCCDEEHFVYVRKYRQ